MARVATCFDFILHFGEANHQSGERGGQQFVHSSKGTIGGTELPALFTLPPSEISYLVDIYPGAQLHFFIGIKPDVQGRDGGGVHFEVLIRTLESERLVFSQYLDSASTPEQRGWLECEVNLDQYRGEDRELIFRTGAKEKSGSRASRALWGLPRLLSSGRAVPKDRSGLPHVFLISLDTVRCGSLDLFGHQRLTAPHLDKLLAECVFFTKASAQSFWTMPSHMSVFTSLTPDVHRVPNNQGKAQQLQEGIPTLAQILRDSGYRTAGFATCEHLKGSLGFDRGFDFYCMRRNDASAQNLLAQDWIESNRQDKMFVFLHYFDVHSDWEKLPYEASAGFDALYTKGDIQPEDVFPGCAPTESSLCASRYLKRLNRRGTLLSQEELDAIQTLYDRGVRQLDFDVARMIAWLKSLGVWENSIVIVFSDHGEEFQEHGRLLHSQLYEELLNVPLLVKLPGGAYGGHRMSDLVELIDLTPTVLTLLGMAVPEKMQGISLVPLIESSASAAIGDTDRSLFSYGGRLWSIRKGQWKLLSWRGVNGLEKQMLFNLDADPAEQTDLFHQRPAVRDELLKAVGEQLSAHQELRECLDVVLQESTGDIFTEAEKKRLESLGYLE